MTFIFTLVTVFNIAHVLYAAADESEKCIFARPGTPYHEKNLCTMDDLGEKIFREGTITTTTRYLAMILDRQNGTNIAGTFDIKGNNSKMPTTEDPDFHHDYFIQNAASFLGEEWIYGQKPRWKEFIEEDGIILKNIHEISIDGGEIERSVWFFAPFLKTPNFYGIDMDVLLGEGKGNSVQYLVKQLEHAVMFEHLILNAQANGKELSNILANYFAGLLEPMREWLIPVYFHSVFGGHVVLMTLMKTDKEHVDMTIYNTGDGVNFHDTLQGNRHIRRNFALKFSGLHVDHDLLNTTFFDMLIEFTTGQRKGDKYDAGLFYNNVLGRFSKYRVTPSEDHRDYSIPQRAGNCYQKVVLAYIKAKLGYHDYKKLDTEMCKKLMNKLYETEFYKRNWFNQEMVVRGLKSEARNLTRSYKIGKISKEELGESVKVVRQRLDVVSAVKLDRYTGANVVKWFGFFKWLHPFFGEYDSTAMRSSEKNLDGDVLHSKEYSLEDPESIIERTRDILDYVNTRALDASFYHGFAWILRLPMPAVDEEDVYKKFSPEKFPKLLNHLKNLLEVVSTKSSRVISLIATAKCLAIVWRSLINMGSPLAKAKLDLTALRQPFDSDKILFYTPEVLKEYTNILEYFEATSNQQGDIRSVLFEGITKEQKGKFDFMSEDSAEYQFLSSIELTEKDKDLIAKGQHEIPPAARMGIGKVLKEEKMKMAYLYMMKNEHVPEEFHLLRDLLTHVSNLSYSRNLEQQEAQVKVTFYMRSAVKMLFNTFKTKDNSQDPVITYRIRNSSLQDQARFSKVYENFLLTRQTPLSNPMKTDLALLQMEPQKTKIFFAINCISRHFADIFADESNVDLLKHSFFQGLCLADFVKSDPLDGVLVVKRTFRNAAQKLFTKALLTGDWSAYKSCKDFEALVYHWLDETPILSLDPRDCPAAYLGHPEALFFIGKKPKYLQEIFAINLKNSYPENFVNELMKMDPVAQKFAEVGIYIGNLTFRHEYPYVSATAAGRTFIYDFWEDDFFSGKLKSTRIYDGGVFADCKLKSEYLKTLAEKGEFNLGSNRFGLIGGTVCKVDNGIAYETSPVPENTESTYPQNNPFSSFYPFEHRTDQVTSSYIIDFKLSLEPEISGKEFLRINEKGVQFNKNFTTIYAGQTWNIVKKMDVTVPRVIDEFGEDRNVIIWSNDSMEGLYIFTDMFTENFQSIIFKCDSTGSCSYGEMKVLEESNKIYQKYPQSIVFTDSNNQQFALLPMESSVNHTSRTPCIKFPLENGEIVPFKREKKIQLALYYMSHGFYKKALKMLRTVVAISTFTHDELVYLNNIIYYNRRESDFRPEQVAVSYYALYMRFQIGNPKLEEDPKVQLFKEFAYVKGKDDEVMDRYYKLIGRIPRALLVTSPVLCAPYLQNPNWIDCHDERHFIEAILIDYPRATQLDGTSGSIDHPRLSQINRKVGLIWQPEMKNMTLNLSGSFPIINIDPRKLIKTSGLEVVSTIRSVNSRLRVQSTEILSIFFSILASLDGEITDADRCYIQSFVLTAEVNPNDSYFYLIALAAIMNPTIAQNLKNSLLSGHSYLGLIIPSLQPVILDSGMNRSVIEPKVLSLPPQISFHGENYQMDIDLKGIRMNQDESLSKATDRSFDTLKAFFNRTVSTEGQNAASLSFSKLKNVLLENSVISRPMNNAAIEEEYREMCRKMPIAKTDLASDKIDDARKFFVEHIALFGSKAKKAEYIVSNLANTPSKEYKEEYNGLILSGLLKKVTVETLLRPYVAENLEFYLQHLKYIDPTNIAVIHVSMHKYMIWVSLLRRFERASKAFEQGEYDKVFEEMQEDAVEPDLQPVVLLMEYHLGFRIRSKNISNIQMMAKKYGATSKNYVLQAIMGSGKTEVISPALAFLKADGEHISMFCPPSTHFETNSEKLLSYSKNFFGQSSYVLNFSRDPQLTNEVALRRMFESLSTSIKERKNVLVKFESLQSMTNQFISLLNSDEMSYKDELKMLGKNLDLMKTKASITFDEVDFTFKTNRMFNFPTGISQEMDQDTIDTMKLVLKMTVELRDQLAQYEIQPYRGNTQNITKTRQKVVKLIADTFVHHLSVDSDLPKPFDWIKSMADYPNIEEKLVHFIVNEPLGLKTTLSSLSLNENHIKFMILAQNLIQSLIPDNWSSVCNLHYGFSKYADLNPSDPMYCGVAKPYAFAGEPKESSSWANKYETAVKTFQMYLENGMTEHQYEHYIMHLQKKALDEGMYFDKDLEATDVVLKFNSYKISNGGEQIKLFHATTEASNCLSSSTKAAMARNLKGTTEMNLIEFILDYIFEIPMKKETFYSSQIVNNAQFMGTRFKILQGFSGTAQRDYQFWENVDFIPDLGSSVAVQSTILEQPGLVYEIEDENDAIYLANSDRTGEFNLSLSDSGSQRVNWINKGFTADFKIYKAQEGSIFEDVNKVEKVKAMIDLGAFFRTMKNEEVARKLLQYSGDEIRSIVYYNQANKLSFMKKIKLVIEGPYELHGENHKDILKETGCSLDQIFVYYDQKHILGSDFKMVDGAVAYVTVGPTTTRTDLEQAVMRMRGLLAKLQTLRFIITKDAASNIKSKSNEDETSEVGLFGIIRHCIDNESQLFKSPDLSGRTNMQNMQLLYQKVKAQYMDVAFTHLTRLAANGDIKTAKALFTDVHDWFIDSTDEFAVIEESEYFETAQVLQGFSDRMFEHLSMIPRWKVVETELLKAKEAVENAIKSFVERNVVEPKTPSPISRKNQNSTEVQNESQNQNQAQTQNQADIVLPEHPAAEGERDIPELTCVSGMPAAMQMRNLWKEKNMNFLDDNIKISTNFMSVESNGAPFIKTPTYFVHLEECIIAVSHREVDIMGRKEQGHSKVFMLIDDKPVWLSKGGTHPELKLADLVNLMIFKGDFDSLNKKEYEVFLNEWVGYRKCFGPQLISIIDSYDTSGRGIFRTSSLKKKLEQELIVPENFSMKEFTPADLEFFEQNPRLGLETIFRLCSPTVEEFKKYFPLEMISKLFAENDSKIISGLLDMNPKFVPSMDDMRILAKDGQMCKLEPFLKSEDATIDISISDLFESMLQAGESQTDRMATLEFMKHASDQRILRLAHMFLYYDPNIDQTQDLAILQDLFSQYPQEFKGFPRIRELMDLLFKVQRQSVMILHVLDFIGTTEKQWLEIYEKYFEYSSYDYFWITFEEILTISHTDKIAETDPSFLDELVKFAHLKKSKSRFPVFDDQGPEIEIKQISNYLFDRNSPFFEDFTKNNQCITSALFHSLKVGHIDEIGLVKALREKESMEEIESIAFELMKNPRIVSESDLLTLIPFYDKFPYLILELMQKRGFQLGQFVIGYISIDEKSELLALFEKYKEEFREHPEYLQRFLQTLNIPFLIEKYNTLTAVLDELQIPYTKP